MLRKKSLKEQILEKLKEMRNEVETALNQIEQIQKQYKLGLIDFAVVFIEKLNLTMALKTIENWEKFIESMSEEELKELVKMNKELKKLIK